MYKYFDRNQREIKPGDVVKNTSGEIGMVFEKNGITYVKLSGWFNLPIKSFAFWGKGDTSQVLTILKPKEFKFTYSLNETGIN